MKTAGKSKAEKTPTKLKTVKGSRRSRSKVATSNGKHPPTTYEHAPIGIVEASLEGTYINVNEEFCRILGYTKEELLGHPLKDFSHEEDYPIDIKLHEQLVSGEIPFYRFEKRYLRKDGGEIWVELTRSIVRDEQGNPLYTIGVVLDISERKHVERVLRESVERLRLATEAAQMFTWEWDFLTNSYSLADSFTQVLGFTTDLLSKNAFETLGRYIPAEDLQSAADAFQKVVESQKDLHSLSCRVINPENGQIVWLEISAKIVYDHEGKPERMFGVAQNITENKEAEEAVQLARRQAEQSADRTAQLQKVTAALSETLTPTQVAEVLASQGAPAFGAVSSSMMLLSEDGQTLEIIYSSSPESLIRPYKRFLVSLPVPAADAVRTGQPVWIESRQQYLERYPHLAEEINHWGHQAAIAIPMVYKERILGVLTLSFDRVMAYNLEDWEYGLTLARQGAQALDRANAENALRESEERFRALVSQATAGITESDMDGRLIFVNPRLCELLGYSELELLGKTVWELTHTDDVEENKRLFQQMLEQGESYQFEKRFMRRDGSPLWTNVTVSTIRDLTGKPKGGVGVVIDIQERKQAEEALGEFARQQAALYKLSDQLHRTDSLEDVFNAALDAILSALQCDRASVLLFDETDVMRFVAWRGLSDGYRKATDGHSPWKPDTKNPQPISMDDIRTAQVDESLRAIIQQEGIGSLAFIPLVSNGKLIGKFMIYFNTTHEFGEDEMDLSLTIANQLAFGIERKRADKALSIRARQQQAVARLGELAVRERDLQKLFDRATTMIAETLEIEYCKVLELLTGNESLRLRSGVGWREGLVGQATVDTGPNSQAGYTLMSYTPVVVVDLRAEQRFNGPPLLVEHSVISGMSCIIRGAEGQPWGVLGAHSTRRTLFTEDDVNFLMAVANILGDAIQQQEAEQALRQSEERYRAVVESQSEMLCRFQLDGKILFVNSAYARARGTTPETLINRSFWEFIPEEDQPGVRAMLDALTPEAPEVQIENRFQTAEGERWTLWTNRGITFDSNGKLLEAQSSGIDITERKQAEKRLTLLAAISDMLRNVDDPYELMYKISESVGEHLHVRRALFNETDLEQDREMIHRDYHRDVDSVAGVHKISDYSSLTSAEMAAGRTVINTDSKTDPRTAQEYEKTYAVSGERAYVAVPLMRDNGWVASFWVSDDTPRQWSAEEVSLLETVAERTWAIIEKLRINKALRASEQRFREIFETAGVSVWVEDFTEVKQAIEGLRARGVRDFRAYFEQNPDFVQRAIRQVRILDVNNETLELFGARNKEDLLGSLSNVFTPETEPLFVDELVALADGREMLRAETQLRTLDGRLISTLFTVHFASSAADQSRVVVTLTDITERKRIEEALRLENERFMRFVDSNVVGILIGNAQGEVLLANDYYLDLLGVTRQDLMEGKVDWKTFTPPEWLPADEKAIQELRERGVCEPYEKEYIRTDGTRVPIYIADALLSGPGEEIAAFVIDISERKRAEEALRRNEKLFSTLVESAPFGVYFIDSEFRLRAINKGSEAVFNGIDPLIGRDFAEILRIVWQEPFATEAIERFRHTLRTGEPFISPPVIEERANIDQIQSYDWQIHRITLPDGSFGVVCYFYDLSEQKKMEATVRASEALYRTIARSIPGGGVYVVDKDFRYLVAEGPVTEAFGLSRQMLEGHSVLEVFPDERGARMEERLQRTFAGETVGFETEHNGRVYWTQQAPLQDSIGQAIILTLDITERKQAEEALRQSEERFVQFMQHLPGPAWIKDMQGRYVYANATAEKVFSTPREKLYGKTDEEIFPPRVAAQFKANDQRALTERRGVQVIETMEQADGVLHSSLVTKFPIPGPDGNPALIGGTAFDITERLQAEEALQESEERFRAILRQATAGIVRKDAEGNLIFVNQAFCNMLGYTESDLLGKTIWEFIHPEDVAENKRSYHRLMEEGIPFKLERRLLRRDGSIIWVDASVSPIMDAAGRPQSAVTVEVDITGRKQAEEALRELNLQLEDRVLSRTAKLRAVNQTLREEIAERKRVEEALRHSESAARSNEEKLRTLFDLLPVGISFLDPKGRIIQMNTALPNILRLPKEQLSSQAYESRKYIRADGMPMSPSEFAGARALAEKKTIHNVETGVLLENGEVVWTNVSAAPVNVADVGVVVVTVDTTDSKRAERALQESHRRLRILSQRLVEVQEDERRALARELHDRVGQTLAALNINLIIINSQLTGEASEQIGTRLNDSMKLVAETIALVRDVMTDLRPSVLDDYGLEAALESHLAQFISRYEIQARLEKPDQPFPRLGPSIEMTMLRIAQEALMNIARHAQATHVNLSLRQEADAVCLVIRDNGIGIESLQEASRPGSHGLTIMRERAEAFGGSLKVSSNPGQGTVVEVSIPHSRSSSGEEKKEKNA